MKIIKVPFSGGGLGHGTGANLAPDVIVKQLDNICANESGIDCRFEIDTSLILDEKNFGESHKQIRKKSESITKRSIYLGGDHSITCPIVKGFAKNNPNFQFIVFDAHPDMMDDFDPPTQEDYLRVLIEQDIIKPENIFVVGLRNCDVQEFDYLYAKGVRYLSCKDIFNQGVKKSVEQLVSWVKKDIYLSIDIDVVDPVEAIGTGYLEHGGLSSRELIYAIQELTKTKKVAMVDLVEVNPTRDIKDMTSILAAKILAELYEE